MSCQFHYYWYPHQALGYDRAPEEGKVTSISMTLHQRLRKPFGVVDISGQWWHSPPLSLASSSCTECSSEWDGRSVVQVLKEVPAGSFGYWWDVCLTPRYARSSRRYRCPYHASSSSPSVFFPFGYSCPRVLRWLRQCPLVDHFPILYDWSVRNCRYRREVIVLGLQKNERQARGFSNC